jgi:hypothetical protein
MDLIVSIWLKLDTLLLIEIVSILNTINVSIQIGYIVYDMVDNNEKLLRFYIHMIFYQQGYNSGYVQYDSVSWIDTIHNSCTQPIDSHCFSGPCYHFDPYYNENTV